jgi:alkanesulfonate monooxygenase SsuD/methylene tetrahydromethanopterin reductase-like flavin-dependent oxidoreductase (luciferase family)
MADYRHKLRFGVMLEPSADWGRNALALADLAEQAGLDLVSLADHPYWTERLDTMTLLSAIVARTSRVTVFPNLANLPLRSPLSLARAAATLGIVSGGRFELGLATGAQQLWEHIVLPPRSRPPSARPSPRNGRALRGRAKTRTRSVWKRPPYRTSACFPPTVL